MRSRPFPPTASSEAACRYREPAEAGVRTAMVRYPVLDEKAVESFAPVIAAFS
ncbi:MAG TPA: hypothetical protein VNT52_17095 [Acidimicrobiales bacterium]|nr:hypothetical protein [Acidimicrobiales bacterium]